jgi:hypothetical protein
VKTVAFNKATDSERKAFAELVVKSINEFISQGHSVTLSRRMVVIKHNTNIRVLRLCCRMMETRFKSYGRPAKWLERGVDILPGAVHVS